jgi:hypothetical protein
MRRPCARVAPLLLQTYLLRCAARARAQHRLLRAYATAHAAALYAAAAGAAPGARAWLQPPAAEALLQALGLWAPSLPRALLPVLALLLLVRAAAPWCPIAAAEGNRLKSKVVSLTRWGSPMFFLWPQQI